MLTRMDDTIYNFHQLNKEKGLKIVHLNIRSLPKKIDQLRLILGSSNIDIFTLSETWLHEHLIHNMYIIQNYQIVRQDRSLNSTKKRGGGVLMFVKNVIETQVQAQESTSSKDLEVQWTRIKRMHAKDILLANVYRPPTAKS